MDADQDLLAATSLLRSALADANGKLRADDARRLAGFERRTRLRAHVIALAMRDLGWDRGRYRFNGVLAPAYARGSSLEREIILDVERGADGQLVVKRRDP